jgi:hypothetical protein
MAGIFMLFAPLATRTLDAVSIALGVHNPGFILMLAFFALCLINLQFSVVLSRLNKHNKQLAQRLALVVGQAPGVPHRCGPDDERRTPLVAFPQRGLERGVRQRRGQQPPDGGVEGSAHGASSA